MFNCIRKWEGEMDPKLFWNFISFIKWINEKHSMTYLYIWNKSVHIIIKCAYYNNTNNCENIDADYFGHRFMESVQMFKCSTIWASSSFRIFRLFLVLSSALDYKYHYFMKGGGVLYEGSIIWKGIIWSGIIYEEVII